MSKPVSSETTPATFGRTLRESSPNVGFPTAAIDGVGPWESPVDGRGSGSGSGSLSSGNPGGAGGVGEGPIFLHSNSPVFEYSVGGGRTGSSSATTPATRPVGSASGRAAAGTVAGKGMEDDFGLSQVRTGHAGEHIPGLPIEAKFLQEHAHQWKEKGGRDQTFAVRVAHAKEVSPPAFPLTCFPIFSRRLCRITPPLFWRSIQLFSDIPRRCLAVVAKAPAPLSALKSGTTRCLHGGNLPGLVRVMVAKVEVVTSLGSDPAGVRYNRVS